MNVWSDGGVLLCHSTEGDKFIVNIIERCLIIASHKMKIMNSTAINEIEDPRDDNIFQDVKESG